MSLRTQSLKGGAYLTVREAMGVVIKMVGVLVLTRLIGPTNYGLFAAVSTIVTILGLVAWMGIDTYLIRGRKDLPEKAFDQAFTLLLVTSVGLMTLGLATAEMLAGWMGDDRYVDPLRVLLLALPLKVLWSPGQAKLERNLLYRRMAALELGADFLFYGTAIVLALLGAGVWAPVAGFAVWQGWLLIGSFILAKYSPRLCWDRVLIREMLAFGFAYSPAVWFERAKDLVNPLVVGRYLGAAAVGYVALGLKLVETLTFVRKISRRVSLVTLSRIQDEPERMGRAVATGLRYQVLVTGAMLLMFSFTAKLMIPILFGPQWSPVLEVLPFLAAALLYHMVYNMQTALLLVVNRGIVVSGAFFIRLAILTALSFILVPSLGVMGYGIGAMVAALGYVPVHIAVQRVVAIDYMAPMLWAAVFTVPLFATTVRFPISLALCVPAVVLSVTPWGRRQIAELVTTVRATVFAKHGPP